VTSEEARATSVGERCSLGTGAAEEREGKAEGTLLSFSFDSGIICRSSASASRSEVRMMGASCTIAIREEEEEEEGTVE